MAIHRIRKGLRLPIRGEPEPVVEPGRPPSRVALLGADYPGMRPTLRVQVGDEVRRGQVVFEDKKTPGVRYTAPGAGRVVAIHRGERRAFLSLVIELTATERAGRAGGPEEVSFSSFTGKHPNELDGGAVRDLLVESGLWTALRGRPFGRVASPEARPRSIFVTAMDTNPLAAPVGLALEGRRGDFERGLAALAKLTDGPVFVCTGPEDEVPIPSGDRFRHEIFTGPHPAGTAGVHIHTLDPVDRSKLVWYVGYQDVAAMGRLFDTGRLDVERIVSLAGPVVRRPRLLRTRLGASLDDLVRDELAEGDVRVVSGSVLSGRTAMGEVTGYLGRYHVQVSALREGREREFLGWLDPGWNKFSVMRVFLSSLTPRRTFDFTTATHGSRRAIVPIGAYEKVMPMDILPTFLLRALLMEDIERAEQLGCLELEEEDLALCTFVDPGKNEFGPYLRRVLARIEKEG